MKSAVAIEHLLEHLASVRGVEHSHAETTWFDGWAWFPMYTQRMRYQHSGWTVEISYEMRMSDQSHRQAEANGAGRNVYLWQLKATRAQVPSEASFSISKRAFMTPGKYVSGSAKIKSTDLQLVQRLQQNRYIAGYFDDFVTLPHVRVAGNMCDEGYEVNLAYNTMAEHQRVAYGGVLLLESVLDHL